MSDVEVVAVTVLAAWMALLTLACLLLVRQLGLITVRLDRDNAGPAPVDDGPDVGAAVPAEVSVLLPDRDTGPIFALVLSAVCAPCRQVATGLAELSSGSPLVALVTGRSDAANDLASLLPADVPRVVGAQAENAVRALALNTTPFVVEIRQKHVAAKAAIRDPEHLIRFIDEADAVSDVELHSDMEVVVHANGRI